MAAVVQTAASEVDIVAAAGSRTTKAAEDQAVSGAANSGDRHVATVTIADALRPEAITWARVADRSTGRTTGHRGTAINVLVSLCQCTGIHRNRA